MGDEPKLDYWMLEILKDAMNDWLKKKPDRVREHHIRASELLRDTCAHRFSIMGQYEQIMERLNEIHVYNDDMIKKGLEIHEREMARMSGLSGEE